MTVHAIYALACLGEDEIVYAVLADFAFEAVCVVRVFTCHNSLIEDREMADVAAVGAVGADGRAIGKEKKICICCDLVGALCTFEAVYMEEGGAEDDN